MERSHGYGRVVGTLNEVVETDSRVLPEGRPFFLERSHSYGGVVGIQNEVRETDSHEFLKRRPFFWRDPIATVAL